MGERFWLDIGVPRRLMTEDIWNEVKPHIGDDFDLSDTHEEAMQDFTDQFADAPVLLSFEVEEYRDPNYPPLEDVLKKHKIPYNRACSATNEDMPDMYYYRPDQPWQEHTVIRTLTDTEVVNGNTLAALVKQNLPAHEFQKRVTEQVLAETSLKVPQLLEYCYDNDTAKQPEMMEQIEEVLAELDAGTINEAEAMKQIKEIKEAHK